MTIRQGIGWLFGVIAVVLVVGIIGYLAIGNPHLLDFQDRDAQQSSMSITTTTTTTINAGLPTASVNDQQQLAARNAAEEQHNQNSSEQRDSGDSRNQNATNDERYDGENPPGYDSALTSTSCTEGDPLPQAPLWLTPSQSSSRFDSAVDDAPDCTWVTIRCPEGQSCPRPSDAELFAANTKIRRLICHSGEHVWSQIRAGECRLPSGERVIWAARHYGT